ncbi:hypothetical protein OROHE_004981 [Orobanche hederae]
MAEGSLEVVLVSAKGLENTDFLWFGIIGSSFGFSAGIDPYAILTCRTQATKSSVVTEARVSSKQLATINIFDERDSIINKSNSTSQSQGACPEWNETFLFTVSRGVNELKIKLMDKDTFTEDDILGEAIIPLEPVFAEKSVETMSYNVVKDGKYCGEVRVGLKFTPQISRDREFCVEDANIGGWRQSSLE